MHVNLARMMFLCFSSQLGTTKEFVFEIRPGCFVQVSQSLLNHKGVAVVPDTTQIFAEYLWIVFEKIMWFFLYTFVEFVSPPPQGGGVLMRIPMPNC